MPSNSYPVISQPKYRTEDELEFKKEMAHGSVAAHGPAHLGAGVGRTASATHVPAPKQPRRRADADQRRRRRSFLAAVVFLVLMLMVAYAIRRRQLLLAGKVARGLEHRPPAITSGRHRRSFQFYMTMLVCSVLRIVWWPLFAVDRVELPSHVIEITCSDNSIECVV
jgi:hypothetical protein